MGEGEVTDSFMHSCVNISYTNFHVGKLTIYIKPEKPHRPFVQVILFIALSKRNTQNPQVFRDV